MFYTETIQEIIPTYFGKNIKWHENSDQKWSKSFYNFVI